MAKTGDPGQHALEYAKTGRSTCHAPAPCKGSFIPQGSLRYGARYNSEKYGEGWHWFHWGCVTPETLAKLKNVKLSQVTGYSKLLSSDKARVTGAIKVGHVAPQDVPASAKPLDWSQLPAAVPSSASSSQKRKAEPSSSQLQSSSTQPASSQVIDLEDSDDEFGLTTIEEVSKDEHYIDLNTQVVGIQYYTGLVGPGEEVNLVREPHNKYDKNAIQVMNLTNKQVGHIKKDIAVRLAPLIDSNLVVVEGTIHEGNMNGFQYSITMTLKVYGNANLRQQLEPLLKWATPGQKGFTDALRSKYNSNYQPPPPSTQDYMGYGTSSQYGGSYGASSSKSYGYGSQQSAAQKEQMAKLEAERRAKLEADRLAYQKAEELKRVIKSFETVDDDSRRSSLLDTLCSNDDILNLPLHENPPSIASGELTTNLMKHQIQALKWCISQEYPMLPTSPDQTAVQFWQYVKKPQPSYLHMISRQPVALSDPPKLGRGAIFGDAMGLGKTLSMIALIISTRKDVPTTHTNSTLIVAPVSVLRTWEAQVLQHCAPGLLSVYTYHEKGREISATQLAKYDVVITSYNVCAMDFAKKTGGRTKGGEAGPSQKKAKGSSALFDIKWKRIILDEGHTIRNPTTKQHAALRELEAERRWVVTGTPIINSPKDLGSLLNFLRTCSPFDDLAYFNRSVIRPLAKGNTHAANLLKGIMSQVCLRRTKEMQNSKGEYLVDLPPVEMTVVRVTLDPEARRLYDEIERLSQERFIRHIDAQGNSSQVKVPFNILGMLTRLRQLTLHPSLVPASYLEELRISNETELHGHGHGGTSVTPTERLRLQHILFQAIEDNEECPVCFDVLNVPRITPCAHSFCLGCISGVIQRDPKCPMDRRPLMVTDLIEPLPPIDATQAQIRVDLNDDEDDESMRTVSSAKIDQLIHLLQLTPLNEKSVVFSQFTGFLDKIADQLDEVGIPYVRFDGSMSATRRRDVLDRFNIPLNQNAPTPAHSNSRTSSGVQRGHKSAPRRIVDPDDDEEMHSRRHKGSPTKPSPEIDPIAFSQALSSDDEGLSRPRKRARPSFLPELSSDDDADLDNPLPLRSSEAFKGKKRAVIESSDDFDPSHEPIEISDDESDVDFVVEDDVLNIPEPRKKGKGKTKAVSIVVSATQRKGAEREALLRTYDIDDEVPVVMLISLKAGALGLQLTAANNVYLMDPWWQEGIESQAIDRCNRIGQTKNVHVFQLIAEDTIESKVLEIQERKRLLIKHAFSGTKSKETQRSTKKEARLQDLIELFGVRRELAATEEASSSAN